MDGIVEGFVFDKLDLLDPSPCWDGPGVVKVVKEAAGTLGEVGDVGEEGEGIEVVSVDPDLEGAKDRIRLLALTAYFVSSCLIWSGGWYEEFENGGTRTKPLNRTCTYMNSSLEL